MLINTGTILRKASSGGYAVAAPNVHSDLDATAYIKAAEICRSPIILGVYFEDAYDLYGLGQTLRYYAEKAVVPVAIHLDHGDSYERCIQAIQAGFTSVMLDRSSQPYAENITGVSEVVKAAHAVGVSVEAELGHVGMAECYMDNIYTDPEEAKKFIDDTGIDSLAVSIGTAHGAYPNGRKPKLDFKRLSLIKKATGQFPLVLHGSSGTPVEDIEKACLCGINKVNISNDLCRSTIQAVQSHVYTGNDSYNVFADVFTALEKKMEEMIRVYGSVGKA